MAMELLNQVDVVIQRTSSKLRIFAIHVHSPAISLKSKQNKYQFTVI